MRSTYLKTVKTAILAMLFSSWESAFVRRAEGQPLGGCDDIILPDGSSVPMWGYTCGGAVGGSTATCAAANGVTAWAPVIITVPMRQDLRLISPII